MVTPDFDADGFHFIVLYRLREGVTLDRLRAAKSALAALVETLPGVRELVVADNVSTEHHGYRVALVSQFEDRRAFEIFDRHPDARAALAALEDLVEERIVVEGRGA